MPDILHLLKIKAAPEQLYQALTTPAGIHRWWTRDADLDTRLRGHGEFRFPAYGPPYATNVTIDDLLPPHRVAWTVTSSFRPEWNGTTITFDLRAEADLTVLFFAHRGFPKPDENYALCNTGWAYYLVSLQQYLQTGRGAPSPDIDFARVLR
ncbi:MAG: SRPBCC domain-containing protein [Acidobacteriota bacterium]|nr:SRPBCC domain-containing protein [Acidobacteriota bacterium]